MKLKQLSSICLALGVLCVLSCDSGGLLGIEPKPPGTALTWVAKTYVGGSQCDPNDRYTPPDIELILRGNGISVYEKTIEPHAVCAACGCPSYAATHYGLINEADVEKAARLGFVMKNPTSN